MFLLLPFSYLLGANLQEFFGKNFVCKKNRTRKPLTPEAFFMFSLFLPCTEHYPIMVRQCVGKSGKPGVEPMCTKYVTISWPNL